MTVRIRYFASLREQMGRDEDSIAYVPGMTVADVWSTVCGDPLAENILSAVNLDYVSPEQHVDDGDEVAFFPPVTGG